MQKKLYLAGPLFNAGERFHNLLLAQELRKLGHKVILPQVEAATCLKKGEFDLHSHVHECLRASMDENNILVACIDGSDADSGTCVEFGAAIATNGIAVMYRTDFRTSVKKEIGVNGMLTHLSERFIYKPCFATTLKERGIFYRELAQEIHEEVVSLV